MAYLLREVAHVRRPNAAGRNVLCVSRIDYQKNQLVLVEALSRLPAGTRLTLVGPVTAAWYRDKILARVDELGLRERFKLIPSLPPDRALFVAARHRRPREGVRRGVGITLSSLKGV